MKEKNAAAYTRLAAERGFNLERAWMIGNSPKSDINPALEAGLNAVYIPHPRTWVLEKEEVRPIEGKYRLVNRFPDLLWHF